MSLMLRLALCVLMPIAWLTAARAQPALSAFDFTFEAIEGMPMPLAGFRGKALLVVNTASFCGFTHQYQGLQALHETYAARGLVVIGVPSNDFGAQEPGSEAEIAKFCQGAFGVTFALTSKVAVKGSTAHPFFAWARRSLGDEAAPRWNFHKYLVGVDGRLIGAFPSKVAPNAPELIKAIEAALPVKTPS